MSKIDVKLTLFSLLHIADGNQGSPNVKESLVNTIDDQYAWDVYVKCAILLAKSCAYFGLDFAVITNKPDQIKDRAKTFNYDLKVMELQTSREVPDDVAFYSAHFKLDALDMFSRGECGEFPALIDLDCVILKDISTISTDTFSNGLGVYDITAQQVPHSGYESMMNSSRVIGGQDGIEPKWYGGEFILGAPQIFKKLCAEVERIWPQYKNHYKDLHHMGDEMIVTTALSNLAASDVIKISDLAYGSTSANGLDILRWWSARTDYQQAPLSAALNDVSILHLPSDKDFLAKQADEVFSPDVFKGRLRAHMRAKLGKRQWSNGLLNILRGQKKWAAKL